MGYLVCYSSYERGGIMEGDDDANENQRYNNRHIWYYSRQIMLCVMSENVDSVRG